MHSSTKSNLLIASCYAGILALGMVVGPKLGSGGGTSISLFPVSKGEKVDQVLALIKDNYVDSIKVDTLQNLAINQILSHLDPHSSYLPPLKARDLSQTLEGNYSGIGVEYFLMDDTILVTGVRQGGPAAKAGIKAGDQVLRIDNKLVAGKGISSQQVVDLIKGRKDSPVRLSVKRIGVIKERVYEVTRGKIIVSSIDASYMIAPAVGYMKISKFGARTDEDFGKELSILRKSGLQSLILDLRHNGGGYLNAATALADEFLSDKKLIVYTEGKHDPRTDYFSTEEGKFEQGKLVVLIDENSASASEIVAGALQDLERAVIIGRRSFGKGLVQEQFNFGDGSALNLTIARYFTPLGRSIQRPYKMRPEEYFDETAKRLKTDEIDAKGEVKDSTLDKSHPYKTSTGRVLYGGGGIMPDIYMPADTLGYNGFYYSLRAKGLLTRYFYNIVNSVPRPSNVAEIINNVSLSEEQFQALIASSGQVGVKADKAEIEIARSVINNEYKAFLAKYYFDEEAFYQVLNASDKVISRSLQELKQP